MTSNGGMDSSPVISAGRCGPNGSAVCGTGWWVMSVVGLMGFRVDCHWVLFWAVGINDGDVGLVISTW